MTCRARENRRFLENKKGWGENITNTVNTTLNETGVQDVFKMIIKRAVFHLPHEEQDPWTEYWICRAVVVVVVDVGGGVEETIAHHSQA